MEIKWKLNEDGQDKLNHTPYHGMGDKRRNEQRLNKSVRQKGVTRDIVYTKLLVSSFNDH